ncbi:MAG TPA: hypothetical protein VEH82_03195 [Acidimicrobiales bacterium]|nr:hypothetical protein [Acidimicrobiales bacterium]
MPGLPEWTRTRRFRIVGGVAVVALAAGGVVLGLVLAGSGGGGPKVATSPAGGTGSTGATGGTDSASSAGGGSSTATSGSAGGTANAAGGAGPGAASTSTAPGPQKVSVMCTTVTGNLESAITLGSCSQLGVTGGSGTFPGSLLAGSGSGTVTWNGTGTTSFVYVVSHPPSQRRKCPEGDTETTLRGSVTGNSPVGVGNVGVKGPLRAKVCVDPRLDVSLLAGRAFQL